MKIAIIGCGNIGLKRVQSIIKDKSCKINFIVGRLNPRSESDLIGKKVAKKINCEYTRDRKKVLNSNIDAVILSTHPQCFKKIGGEILKAKKHLLIEKPLGLKKSDAIFLTKLAKKNELILKTGFNLRFDDGIKKAKYLLESNKLGKIYFMKISYVNGSVKTNKNNIGALLDIGSHSINLFEHFFNTKPKVADIHIQSNEYHKDDNGFMLLKHKNILCSIHFSFVRWENQFFMEISGEKGFITIESLPKWGKQTVTLGKRKYPSGKPKKQHWNFFKDNSWYNEWIYFKKCIIEQNNQNLEEGLLNMSCIDQIKRKLTSNEKIS